MVIAVAAGGLWLDYQRFVRQPLNLAAEQVLLLEPGTTQSGLLHEWAQNGWLVHRRDRLWLRWRQLVRGLSAHVQVGEYWLRPGQTLLEVLDKVQRGAVVMHQLTIVEGWRFADLRAALAAEPALQQRSASWSDAQIMSAIGRPETHPEGRFLPETYAFTRGMSDLGFLSRAARAMDEALAEAWRGRAEGLPLKSPDDALILASIVEKETGRADERRRIAGVFVERLRRGMRLQTDPTVIYGLGEGFDGNLRRVDLRRDTPYNTYTRHGLPPTPIALPGRAAIEAAVQPQVTGELYFVSRGDGSHVFSKSLGEHEKNVRRYQLR